MKRASRSCEGAHPAGTFGCSRLRDAHCRVIAIGEQLDAVRPFEESDLAIELDEVRAMLGALEQDLARELKRVQEAA